jgi:hypothetical protein
VPAETCRHALDSAKRPNRRQKPPSSRHFSGNLRQLSWERAKNSGKTSKKSIKNGGNWRFFEGKSAISTYVYARGTEAHTAGILELMSSRPAAWSELLTDNSKSDRHLSGRDSDRRVSDRGDLRVAPIDWDQHDEPFQESISAIDSTLPLDLIV